MNNNEFVWGAITGMALTWALAALIFWDSGNTTDKELFKLLRGYTASNLNNNCCIIRDSDGEIIAKSSDIRGALMTLKCQKF